MSDNKETPAAKETPPATEAPPTPPKATREQALAHLKKCREYQMSNETVGDGVDKPATVRPRFEGQPGFNPYLYITQVIAPWENKIENGVASDSDYDAILKIPIETKPDGNSIKVTQLKLSEYIEQARKLKAGKA